MIGNANAKCHRQMINFGIFCKMWSQTKENVCCRANVTWRNYTSCQNVTWRNYTGKVAKRAFQDCDQIFQGDQIKQICNFPCIINLNWMNICWKGLLDFMTFTPNGNFSNCRCNNVEKKIYLKLHFLEIFPISVPPLWMGMF